MSAHRHDPPAHAMRREDKRLGRIHAEGGGGPAAAAALARLHESHRRDYLRIARFVSELLERLEGWEGEAIRQFARAEGIDVPRAPELTDSED